MRYEKEGPNTMIVTSSTPVQQFLTTEQLHVEDPMPKEGHVLRLAIFDVRYDSSSPGPTLSIPASYNNPPP